MANSAIRRSNGEKAFNVFNIIILSLVALSTLYPFLYVLFASFSNGSQLLQHKGALLWFQGFSTAAYNRVFSTETVFIGFKNTLFYLVVGVIGNMFFTVLGAYALSRKGVMLSKPITLLLTFTMYFSGGMIPTYMIYHNLGLVGSKWAIIVNGLISTYNMIILISSFREMPEALEESARIDGAGDWTILFRIVVPLSMPSIMVITLYYAVSRWNSWFPASLYLTNVRDWPIQMFLRRMLIEEQMEEMMAGSGAGTIEADSISQTLKYAMIMVSTVPILVVYPFIQRYFVKGIMIGAVKG